MRAARPRATRSASRSSRARRAFWRFSLRAYRRPEVARACLALQDGCGADVNLLLFCCWAARCGRALALRELRAIVAAVEPWHNGVVRPLRAARRAIRKDRPELQTLRKRIAASELRAERVEQDMLAERLPPAAFEVRRALAARASLEAYLRLLHRGIGRSEARLLAALVRTAAAK